MKITANLVVSVVALAVISMTSAHATVPAADTAQLASLSQRTEQLQVDVERAEAIKAVKRVQYAYGHYLEQGMWRDLADLFADDAIGYYPAGKFVGKKNLYQHFLQNIGGGKPGLAEGQFRPHIVLQPVVTLDPDGKTAKGRWHVLAMLGNYGVSAGWAGGIYENEYTLDRGVWKIKTLHYHSQYSGSYEKGWNEVRKAGDARPARKLQHPANGPREEACETYLEGCTIPFHYDVKRAGIPVPDAETRSLAAKHPSVAALQKQYLDLAQRVQRMNDEAEVARLQHIYGYYLDRKLWDDVADLFASDASMELGQKGVYVGKASIRRAHEQFGPQGLRDGELNDHLQLQTVVTIAPDRVTAKARGVQLGMMGVNGGDASWGEGIFENDYVNENGVWKIKSLHFYPRMLTDYYQGWAKDAKSAPGPKKDFPPDRPPTVVFQTYPKVYLVPIHFSNPVTGRPAQFVRAKSTSAQTSNKLASNELASLLTDTERRLAVAKAYDGAENVANAYGYYIDEFYWDDMADLFAEQGSKELSYIGTYVGRERIRKSVKLRYATNGRRPGSFTLHQKTQPVIHVAPDGMSAKIRTRLFQVNGAKDGDGSYIAGIYENEAVKENGVWKIKSMDLDYTWTTSYKSGWARVGDTEARRFAPRGNSTGGVGTELPPDRPLRGVVYAPFPKIADLAFHYKNPVSGREPKILLP